MYGQKLLICGPAGVELGVGLESKEEIYIYIFYTQKHVPSRTLSVPPPPRTPPRTPTARAGLPQGGAAGRCRPPGPDGGGCWSASCFAPGEAGKSRAIVTPSVPGRPSVPALAGTLLLQTPVPLPSKALCHPPSRSFCPRRREDATVRSPLCVDQCFKGPENNSKLPRSPEDRAGAQAGLAPAPSP